jgi:hypothetical protein
VNQDIRLYYYDCGTLHKIKGLHKFKSIKEAKEALKKYVSVPFYKKTKYKQYILVEYYAPYDSKIIELINGIDL